MVFTPSSFLRKSSSWGWPAFLWGWTFFVFLAYFSVQSFDLSFLNEWVWDLHHINGAKFLANFKVYGEAVLIGAATTIILWRVGRKLWAWLRLDSTSPILRFSFEIALGILFLNGLWLGLGLNGLWLKSLMDLLEVFLIGWALWDWKTEKDSEGAFFTRRFPLSPFRPVVFLAFGFMVLNFAQVMLPETYYDALVYHLSVLQYWDDRHGILNMPGNLYSDFPFEAELYLRNGFFFCGSQAAKFLNVEIFLLTAISAGAWVAEHGNRLAGELTTASVLFLPLLSTTTWAAQNDVFVAYFILLFVYGLVKWGNTEGNLWFIVSGLMGGMAFGAKYTAVPGLFAVGGVWIFMSSRAWLRKHANQGILMLFLVMGMIAPWLLKNYVFTGDIFYPYFPYWLGGQTLSHNKMTHLLFGSETSWVENHSLGGWIRQILTRDLDKTIAPLLLAFIPFFFLKTQWKKPTGFLLGASLLYLLLEFGVSHELRLAIPALVLLWVAMGFVLSSLNSDKIRSWSWVVFLFGIWSFISLTRVGVSYYHLGQMWAGYKNEKEYLETAPQTRSYYGLTEAVENLTAPTDRILIVGDARGLYFPRDYYANSVFDVQLLATLAQQAKNGKDIWRQLEELGINDLAVSGEEGRRLALQNPSYYPLNGSEWHKLNDFIEHWTDLRWIAGFQGLYHLRQAPIAHSRPIPDLLLLMKTSRLKT